MIERVFLESLHARPALTFAPNESQFIELDDHQHFPDKWISPLERLWLEELQQPRIERAHNRQPNLNFREAHMVRIQDIIVFFRNNHAGYSQNRASCSRHPNVSQTLACSRGRFRVPSSRKARTGQLLQQLRVKRNGIDIERRFDRGASRSGAALYVNQDLKY